jgi:hypothetical protein
VDVGLFGLPGHLAKERARPQPMISQGEIDAMLAAGTTRAC